MSNIQSAVFSLIFFLVLSIHAQKTYQKTYFDNGILKEEGWIKNTQKVDYWKFYYENGVLHKEGHFSVDKEVKYWYYYRKDGSKESEGHFVNGKKINGGRFMMIWNKSNININ